MIRTTDKRRFFTSVIFISLQHLLRVRDVFLALFQGFITVRTTSGVAHQTYITRHQQYLVTKRRVLHLPVCGILRTDLAQGIIRTSRSSTLRSLPSDRAQPSEWRATRSTSFAPLQTPLHSGQYMLRVVHFNMHTEKHWSTQRFARTLCSRRTSNKLS